MRGRLLCPKKQGMSHFISTFTASERIIISTTAENHKQINLTLGGIKEPFAYSERSSCGRGPLAVGTTVRVHLRNEFLQGARRIDMPAAVKHYVRHPAYVSLTVEAHEQALEPTWNVVGCQFTRTARAPRLFEMTAGISTLDGHFTVSSGGFLVNEDPENLLPYYMPRWVVGEANFWPGALDLNLARDTVITNSKSATAKRHIRETIRKLLLEYIAACRRGDFRDNDRIRDLALLYYKAALGKQAGPAPDDSPLFTKDEAKEIILDVVRLKGEDGFEDLTLRDATVQMKASRRLTAYAYWVDSRYPAMRLVIRWLRAQGILVFEYFEREVGVHGMKGGLQKVSEFDVLSAVLGSQGIKLQRLDDLQPKDIRTLSYDMEKLPGLIRTELLAAQDTTKLSFVNVPNAELAFHVGDVFYINAAHPAFKQLMNRCEKLLPEVLRAYLLGVTQQSIEKLALG